MHSRETVVRIAPKLAKTLRPENGPPDATLLLVAALVAAAGPEIAHRAETMLSLMAAVDPSLMPDIAQAKRLAIEARRIADAVAGTGVAGIAAPGVQHDRLHKHISLTRRAMG